MSYGFSVVYSETGINWIISHNHGYLEGFSKDPEVAKPSSRKHVNCTLFIPKNFTRHFMTFLNTDGADVSPKKSTVNTKYMKIVSNKLKVTEDSLYNQNASYKMIL